MLNNNVKKWVEALRSGKYKQGTRVLLYYNKFCCLGVACDLYQKEFGDLEIKETSCYVFFDDENFRLPEKVQKWLNLQTPSGDYDNYRTSLIDRNDFNKIANVIESEPTGLFADSV